MGAQTELHWRYLEGATGHSSGFEAPGFVDSGWALGYGPFARNDPGFGIYAIRTPWVGANNDLCARAHLTVAAGATAVTLIVRIDYSALVYVNGTLVATLSVGDHAIALSTWITGDNVIAVRAHADAPGENLFSLVAPVDYDSSAMRFDVYQIDAPGDTLTFLATLDDAESKSIRPARNEPGSGAFDINRNSPNATAAILAPGNLVKVRIPEIDPGYIYAFFMEQGGFKLVATDEEGGEVITIGGDGALSYWDRAIWLAEKFTTPWWDAGWGTPPGGALGHVTFAAGSYRRYTISGGVITGYTNFTTTGFEAYYDTRQTYQWPSANSKRFLVHIMAGETHAGWYVHPNQDGVLHTRSSQAVGTSASVLLSDISPDTPGAILYRLFAEGTDPARPTHPIPLAERAFTATLDSNGNAWATTDALSGLTAELGETYLDTIAKLLSTGAIDIEMGPNLTLYAYNSQGRDLSGTTFGAGKVRFVKGVNIADELRRERDDNPVATFIEVVGTDNAIGQATLPDAASRVARETAGTGDSDSATVLDAIGLAALNARLIASDAIGFRIATGDNDATGLYLPGPAGTAHGKFWLGDITTLHTGTGEQDFNQEDERVYAVTIAEGDARNLDVTPEVGSVLGEAERRLYANQSARSSTSFTSRSQFTDTEVAEPPHTITLPWSYAQADGGLVGDGATDDTAAFQAWITSVTASGTRSGWFFFEPGTYLIGGALQDTGAGGFNGQILLPNVAIYPNTQITLTFQGAARPPLAVHGVLPAPAGYAIIKSSLTGASGTAAVISGGQGPYTTYQNNISVVVRDLICIAPDNPTMTFWNLSATQGGGFEGVLVSVDTWLTASQNTHANAYGVKLPQKADSNYTLVDGLLIGGFYTGLLIGELTIAKGLGFGLCIVGVEVPDMFHPAVIVSCTVAGCPYGIRVTGGATRMDVLLWDVEHYATPTYPAWQVTVYDLDDASNYLVGNIHWFGLAIPALTVDHSFTVNGGTNSTNQEVGTTIGPAFATPAIVLGTAAAAGSAPTVIRSDSTIVAFDATAPTTSAIGDAAATGSTAKAARRDHVHGREALSTATPLVESGSGAVGTGTKSSREDHIHPAASSGSGAVDHEHIANVVFSGDGATTVWELPAAPVDSTGIAVYVTGSRSIGWVLSGALLTTLTFDSAPASAANNIVIDIEAAVA